MSEPITGARTFWELLELRVAATPDAPMLLDPDGRRLTFAEFKDAAERTAAGLAALGVGEGTAVTWVLPTRIETVVASFALSRLGAVQNPIIQIYRDREVGFCVRQTAASHVLVPGTWNDYDYVAMVERVTADLPQRPRIIVAYDSLPEGDPATLPPPPAPPADADEAPIRWIYYTSGTTSDPKGVQHTDQTLIAGGIGLAHNIGMSPDDVGSIAFPYAHIGGPDYIVTQLAVGFPAVLLERFVLGEAVEVFKRLGVTMAGGSTAFYTMFLNEQRKDPSTKLIPSLRLMAGGGAPKPPEVYFEVKAEMGIPVAHGYGMTECPMICQNGAGGTDEQLAYTEGPPVLDCEVSIVKEDGSDADPGEEGEVRVAGPMLFKGYTDPALNEGAFDERGRFRTGDLGVKHADGHVTLTGRVKDIIIRKGENISAKEVEDILYAHPKVGNVAVVGLPDRERGERVCAVVEPAPGQEPPSFEEMVAHCKAAGLMTQKIPEQLEVAEVLPRNATLKILKYQLRDELKDKPWPSAS
jgi:cyclohexanecarboxylate-CoA ligase